MSSSEYLAEAKAYLSSMSEHDLEESGDEFQRLFGYAMELSLALTARDELVSMMREYVAQPPDGEYGRARWYWTDEKLKEVLSRCDAMEKANG